MRWDEFFKVIRYKVEWNHARRKRRQDLSQSQNNNKDRYIEYDNDF